MFAFFKDFRNWLRGLLTVIPAKVKIIVSESLQVTTAIKNILNNPVADVITAIIPGDWDDKLKATVLEAIEKVLPELMAVDACKHHTELLPMLECWIDQVRAMPKHLQNATLAKLAALLAAIRDTRGLKQNEYDYYVQLLYSSNKELKNERS